MGSTPTGLMRGARATRARPEAYLQEERAPRGRVISLTAEYLTDIQAIGVQFPDDPCSGSVAAIIRHFPCRDVGASPARSISDLRESKNLYINRLQ